MMSAYESRLRTAPIEDVEDYMRENGIMAEFYEAFPNYEKRDET